MNMAGVVLSAALVPNTATEVSVKLPLAQLSKATILVPILWKLHVWLGINALGVDNSVVLYRIGTMKDGSTSAGSNNRFLDDPSTIMMGEEIISVLTSGAYSLPLGREYHFQHGIVVPRGELFFWIANQAASAENLSAASGMKAYYTMVPLQSAELLQAVVS